MLDCKTNGALFVLIASFSLLLLFFSSSLFIVDVEYLQIVILFKLQQTNTNRLHLASYSVEGNQKHFFLVIKIIMIMIKKEKTTHLQIKTIIK